MRILTLAGILCTGALWSLSSPASAHSGIEPAPREQQWWQDRQALLNARVREGGSKARIVFIGDSIFEGFEGPGKAVWDQYYAPRGALNLAIGGDETRQVLWRLSHGNLEGLNPDLVVLLIGTNNIPGFGQPGQTLPQVAEGVAAIVAELRKALPKSRILLVANLPSGENPNIFRGQTLQLNQMIHELADGSLVYYVDPGHLFIERDGVISSRILYDYVHLSEEGFRILAAAIEPQIAALMGPSDVLHPKR